jgi:phage terminase large subunit-like protein
VWLLLAGRGFGKTRTGAEWIRAEVENGRRGRLALVAPTAADARDVMIEGESGLLAISPPWNRPRYEPSKRRLTWPSGAIATAYSAEEADRLRGPQHDGAWADELAAWTHPETWDMLQFGLRLGDDPRAVVTTTPRPVRLVRELLEAKTTAVTHGSTYDNRANLPEVFFESIIRRYEGTRLGRQELNAELLEDNPLALWRRETMLEAHRMTQHPELVRVVVAVDPQVADTDAEDVAETGIVVVGLGDDGQGYVLADRSLRASPAGWGKEAVTAYHAHRADRLVAEVNNGGAMVKHVIETADKRVGYQEVHASRGKQTRAEPVAALYEQGRVHHVGTFPELEDQMCSWVPGERSPDRMDALVWAITELMLDVPGELTSDPAAHTAFWERGQAAREALWGLP